MVTYLYYNNIISAKPEIDLRTVKLEQHTASWLYACITTFFIGFSLTLYFIISNLQTP